MINKTSESPYIDVVFTVYGYSPVCCDQIQYHIESM